MSDAEHLNYQNFSNKYNLLSYSNQYKPKTQLWNKLQSPELAYACWVSLSHYAQTLSLIDSQWELSTIHPIVSINI